jgi:hypothetical protein
MIQGYDSKTRHLDFSVWRNMNRTRATHLKREKEKARRERQQQKIAKRAEAGARRGPKPKGPGGEDPDIAGIQPGPQPSPWEE